MQSSVDIIGDVNQLQPPCTVTGEVKTAKRGAVNHLLKKPTFLSKNALS